MIDYKNLLILVNFCLLFGCLGMLELKSEHLFNMFIECYAISLYLKEIDGSMIQDKIIELTDTLTYPAAFKLYEKWLDVAEIHGDQKTEGSISLSLGLLQYQFGNFHKALQCFKRSLAIAKETGNKAHKIKANLQIGYVCADIQEDGMAIEHFQEFLKLCVASDDSISSNTPESVTSNLGKVYSELASLFYKKANYQKAIDFFEKAIPLVSNILSVDLHEKVGSLYEEIGDIGQAISNRKKGVDTALHTENATLISKAYSHLGKVFQRQKESVDAFDCYQYELAFALDSKDKGLVFLSYLDLAEFFGTSFRFDEAFQYYSQCVNVAVELNDNEKLAKMFLNLGLLFFLKCDYQRATEYYEKALKIFQQTAGDKEGEGIACHYLGRLNVSLGKSQDALKLFERALSIANESSNDEKRRDILRSLGILYGSLGKEEAAKQCLESLERLSGTDHEDLEIQAKILDDKVFYCLESSEYEKAKEYSLQQLEIAKKISSDHDMLRANATLASIAFKEESYQDVIQYSETIASLATKLGEKSCEVLYHILQGNCYFAQQNYKDAISQYKDSLKVSTMIEEKSYENYSNTCLGISYYHLAKYESSGDSVQEMYNISVTYLKEAIRGSDWLFHHLYDQDDLKISIFKDFVLSYNLLTEVLVVLGQGAEALLVSDRGRGRALSDLLISKYQIHHKDAVKLEAPLTKYDDVQEVLLHNNVSILFYATAQSLIIFHLSPDKPVNHKVVRTQGMADFESARFGSGGTIKPDGKLIGGSYLHSLIDKTYKKIANNERTNCENRSLNSYTERGNMDVNDGPGRGSIDENDGTERGNMDENRNNKRSNVDENDGTGGCNTAESGSCRNAPEDLNIQKQVENILIEQSTLPKRKYRHPLEEWFDMLITPTESDLSQEEVVIIPQGPLYLVPFAALQNPTTGQYLYETKRIRLIPSIATLKTLQECPLDYHVDTGALVIGNPAVGEVMLRGKIWHLPDLPQAVIEANLISYHLKTNPLVGSKATKEEVKIRLTEGVSVIHIAAHADSERGEIALAPSQVATQKGIPDEEDYLLTMKEVQEIGIPAKLVVLSCCHSGGGDIKAEGVVGMSRAFIAAGARSVVASLWSVNDTATLSFMTSLYNNLKQGLSVGKSLQNAIKEIRAEGYRDPKYWAPFFLLGDDVQIF